MKRIQASLLAITLLCFTHICYAISGNDAETPSSIKSAQSREANAEPPAPFKKEDSCKTAGKTGAEVRLCLQTKQIDRMPINVLTAPQGAAEAPNDPN